MRTLKILIPLIALIAIAQGAYCDAPRVVTQTDGEIAPDTLSAIHAINDTLFQSMKDNKPLVMINMFVAEGRNDPALQESVKNTYEKLGDLTKGTAFNILHEYLINAEVSGTASVTLAGEGANKLIINVDAGKGPLFISLLTTSGNFKDITLCFVYLKTKDGWQLYTFNSGIYKVAGKDPVQWYLEAKEMFDKGWDIPAMLWMQFVASFVHPAPFIQYEREKEMLDFFRSAAAEAAKKYKFPFKATWVKDTPTIYGLDTQFVKGRLVPVVIYVTKHPLNSVTPIQDEVDAINSRIEKAIPGITKCGIEVGYRAFTEPPLDSQKEKKYRTLTSTVK